jgi:hypothetical protein
VRSHRQQPLQGTITVPDPDPDQEFFKGFVRKFGVVPERTLVKSLSQYHLLLRIFITECRFFLIATAFAEPAFLLNMNIFFLLLNQVNMSYLRTYSAPMIAASQLLRKKFKIFLTITMEG